MTLAEKELCDSFADFLRLPQETRWLEFKENCLDIERIGEYGQVGQLKRADLSRLIEKLLPQQLSDKQRYHLVSRMISELSIKDRRIQNIGKKGRGAVWKLVER